MNIPRPEHPNPIFERKTWKNLNGKWDFEFDFGTTARTKPIESLTFSKEIIVPFCPESKLSGINYKDIMNGVIYRRNFSVTKEQLEGRVFINFGAVDYEAHIYINGNFAFCHRGGYSSFGGEITKLLNEGENTVIVIAEDTIKEGRQPLGKQSINYASAGCCYTRTTGIWQTVWLEFTPKTYIKKVKYYPDILNKTLIIDAQLEGEGTFQAKASYKGKAVGSVSAKSHGGSLRVALSLSELHLWEVGCGRLYDLELTYGEDTVSSYFGMRSVRLDGMKFLLNEKAVFQRLVLDQGYYPDGIYTAKDDEALKNDIQLSLDVGFNGARLHQKIFEPRFLYHCDKMGYIVWGEHGSWGIKTGEPSFVYQYMDEWAEAVDRDFNHPAIIGWCPFNETWNTYAAPHSSCKYDNMVRLVYDFTKMYDTTRPCIDTSGGDHVKTDIFDVHYYEQNPEKLADFLAKAERGENPSGPNTVNNETYGGEPLFLSEYGGARWIDGQERAQDIGESWGYGNEPKTREEFIARFKGLADAVMDRPDYMGLCYTQLYDVEQEQNGLYTYERKAKFDCAKLKAALSRKAAIEE